MLDAKIVGKWTIADPPIIALGSSLVVFKVFKAPFFNDLFAMKAEVDMPTCRIGCEANLLRRLNSINCRTQHPPFMWLRCSRVYISASVPTVIDFETVSLGGLLVMFHVCSMLGDTLHRGVKDNNGMPLKDVYKVGHDIVRPFFLYISFAHVAQLQMLKAIHSDDLCYNDLKPANILWHLSAQAWGLVDFDCSSAPFEKIDMFEGTPMFASSRALERGGWKMEDDFEGLLRVLVWCIKGELPWQSLVSSSKAFKKDSQRYNDYYRRRLPFIAELALPDKLDKFCARIEKDRGAAQPDAALYDFFAH